VTVATNMAGRGVDIKIDDEVRGLGGLFILGTERHESRRIDNQLRGRSGRQGDPGESQFFLSLDDNLLRIFGSEKIRNIMSKLGVERGEYIDSKLVTRSVEKAQKKVESMHYESRKNILEYDDVANHQRKAIYAFRNQLLDTDYDMSAKIEENHHDFVRILMDQTEIYAGMPTEDYDLEGLCKRIEENSSLRVDPEELKEKEPNEIESILVEKLLARYDEKMSPFDAEQRKEIESILYLQILDPQWRDHLYEMDVLKTGIGLRGYNQKDPLTEYKQESYRLFEQLVDRIKFEAVKLHHLGEFNFEAPEEEVETLEHMRDELEVPEDAIEEHGFEEPQAPQEETKRQPIVAQKKPKRNDPCPCGSGKKYKHCCGKRGPKNGALA
jgi:preprotein translocase subunit SecA